MSCLRAGVEDQYPILRHIQKGSDSSYGKPRCQIIILNFVFALTGIYAMLYLFRWTRWLKPSPSSRK